MGWKKALKDKGFYITLAVCLIAVGVVAAVSLSYALPTSDNEGDTTPTTVPTTLTTTAQNVQNPVTNIADLRTTNTTVTTTTTATTAAPVQALYVLPLSNEVSRAFSNGTLVYSDTMNDWRVHNGVDFTGQAGQSVKAVAAGRVTAIKEDVLWGHTIEIDHGYGIVSRYCGVAARNIQVGDTVDVGAEIGVLDTIPCETADGDHLHLEILSSGTPLDAVAVIGLDVRYQE